MSATRNFGTRIFAIMMAAIMLLGVYMPGNMITMAYAEEPGDVPAFRFSFDGAIYDVAMNSKGSGDGVEWACDEQGNLRIQFFRSGEFACIEGGVENGRVTVIGGGAGGSSAWGREWGGTGHGGNGGGGGSVVSEDFFFNNAGPVTYKVVVGTGGEGALPKLSDGTFVNDNSYPVVNVVTNQGQPGGDSSFGSLVASGGQPNAGGTGGTSSRGVAGTGNNGGGGGVVDTFFETACAVYCNGNWACFNCGYYTSFGINWSDPYPILPWSREPTNPGNRSGGAGGPDGGGTGGTPVSEHYIYNGNHIFVSMGKEAPEGAIPCTGKDAQLNGYDGTDGFGGGGGGGAFSSRCFRADGGPAPYNEATGSTTNMYYVGEGGRGGDGAVIIEGQVKEHGFMTFQVHSNVPEQLKNESKYYMPDHVYVAIYGSESDAMNDQNRIMYLPVDPNGYTATVSLPVGDYFGIPVIENCESMWYEGPVIGFSVAAREMICEFGLKNDAPRYDGKALIIGKSLSLDGNIGLKVYYDLAADLLESGDYFDIEVEGENDVQRVYLSEMGHNANGYFIMASVPAAEVNNQVRIRLFSADGRELPIYYDLEDEFGFYDSGISMKVQDCIDVYLKSEDSKLQALAEALNDYCSYSQAQFNYKVDNRAPIIGDHSHVTAELLKDFACQFEQVENADVEFYGGSLTLESETTVNTYYNIKRGAASDYNYFANGNKVSVEKNRGYWRISQKNIASTMLNQMVQFVVKDSDGNEISRIMYGPMTYAYMVLREESYPETLKDVCRALYDYSIAANEYFVH